MKSEQKHRKLILLGVYSMYSAFLASARIYTNLRIQL